MFPGYMFIHLVILTNPTELDLNQKNVKLKRIFLLQIKPNHPMRNVGYLTLTKLLHLLVQTDAILFLSKFAVENIEVYMYCTHLNIEVKR